MTDIMTEHYQENPEGARLVSNDEIRVGKSGSASAKKNAKSAAGKSKKQVRSDKRENPVKPENTAKKQRGSSKAVKPAKKAVERKTDIDESAEQSQSVKTPSVMRLVEERAFSENQVIAAGKSLIPRQLRGIEPLSKVMRREAELQITEQRDDEVSRSPMVMRELTEMAIAENVPVIIKRFNACDCEKCKSELARLAAEEIPSRYMKIPELADLSWSGFSNDERMLIDSLKKNAVAVMIRIMIANKKRSFH